MPDIHVQTLETPIGELLLGTFEGKLCLCDWRYRKMRSAVDNRIQTLLKAQYQTTTDSTIKQAEQELSEYFAGERTHFTIPLLFAGSEFQQRVWQALLNVEYGQTTTYGALAKDLEQPKAVRAVASANGANALSIIVPCHRVIGSDGSLVGYAGGIKAKEKLLKLENSLLF
ncbi:6-O-methylguanine DNA methyltransferase [Oleiphilus messinensis]|uniref:Methylated-DNA--protein-cysteine methyltransferase n=1 Tax=Oleiphilus messinensis TaxID=141451 RepID=A0A1Y0IEG7_9GAMM|nr:methylated-DNA--[protein]-cysteine S-methyltransferase [Oleiphilus messinensis]ARU58928.1 6-O-methylguanine DNA methyltransferase [Oleiphilus messinensis]